jgi:glucuronoarabinoxylan endo-1,4-beta-xylanase
MTAAVEPGTTELPREFVLHQNYPNPFNPRTVVSSQLPVASQVRLVVYDLLGREVAVLVDERRAAGSYRDTFDASGFASGVYIYRLSAGSFVESRKMVLIK